MEQGVHGGAVTPSTLPGIIRCGTAGCGGWGRPFTLEEVFLRCSGEHSFQPEGLFPAFPDNAAFLDG